MDKKKELEQYIMKRDGIFEATEVEAQITKMASMLPSAIAEEKGLTTDVDKAHELMLIETKQTAQPVAPTDTTSPQSTLPTSGITAKEELAIARTLFSQRETRAAVSANSAIEELILDKPDPHDIIPKGTEGMINEKSWKGIMDKIEKGDYIVKPDDGPEVDADKRIASTTNFEKLKAAQAAGKPVPVMIGKLNTNPIGYNVRKGSVTGQSQTIEQMKRSKLERFVVMETAGYILASESKPGVQLKYIKGRTDQNNPGVVTQGKTILADANKKEAIKAGSYVISREITKELEPTNCRSEMAFRVIVKGKTMKDNVTPLTRTIRLTLKADIPTLKRKDEFIDEFGTGEKEGNAQLLNLPTEKQAQAIDNAQRKAMAMLRQKSLDPNTAASVADIQEQLMAFTGAGTEQAPAAAVI